MRLAIVKINNPQQEVEGYQATQAIHGTGESGVLVIEETAEYIGRDFSVSAIGMLVSNHKNILRDELIEDNYSIAVPFHRIRVALRSTPYCENRQITVCMR